MRSNWLNPLDSRTAVQVRLSSLTNIISEMVKKDFNKTIKRREFEIQALADSFELPVRAKKGSVGYDLTVPEDFVVPAYSRCRIPLRFAINLPYGVEAKIEARSGASLKGLLGYGEYKVKSHIFGFIPIMRKQSGRHHFDADVLTGKIDPNYIDEVHVLVKNNGGSFIIKAGTRIAQMTFYNVGSPFFRVVDKLTSKNRGGGFGSSGYERIERQLNEPAEPITAPHISSEDIVNDINQVDVM